MEITETIARKVLEVVDAGLVNGLGQAIPGEMCVEAAVCFALGLPHGDDPKCVAPSLRSLKIRLNDAHWSSKEARAKGLRRLAVAQLGSVGVLDEKEFVKRIVDYAIHVSTPKALRISASLQSDPAHKAKFLAAANRCEVKVTRVAAAKAAYAAKATYAANTAKAAYNAVNTDAVKAAYAANAAYAAYNAANAAYNAADADADADAAAAAANAAAAAAAAYAAYAARDQSLAEYAEAVVQILVDLKAPGCQWLPLTEAIP